MRRISVALPLLPVFRDTRFDTSLCPFGVRSHQRARPPNGARPGVMCFVLALRFGFGPRPQSTDAPSARGDELLGRTELGCAVSFVGFFLATRRGGKVAKLTELIARLRAILRI